MKSIPGRFAQEMVASCLFVVGMLHLPQSQKALDLSNRKEVWVLAVLAHYAQEPCQTLNLIAHLHHCSFTVFWLIHILIDRFSLLAS